MIPLLAWVLKLRKQQATMHLVLHCAAVNMFATLASQDNGYEEAQNTVDRLHPVKENR